MPKIFRIHKSNIENEWFTSITQPVCIEAMVGYNVESKPKFDKDTIIWRYLDFSKFIALLESQIIHFTRLDDFYDKYEGAYPPSDYERFFTNEFWGTIEKSLLSQLIDISVRLGNFASCWHINNHENYGMWRSYINSNEGVAIKTTVGNLMDSLDNSKHSIVYGNVEYVDFESLNIQKYFKHNQKNGIEIMPIPSFFKRKSFSFEQEFRAVIYFEFSVGNSELVNQEYIDNLVINQKRFFQVPIELNKLIDEIYIHPNSPIWFDHLIENIMERYNIVATVRKSEI